MKKQLDFLVQYEVEFQGWQRRSSGKELVHSFKKLPDTNSYFLEKITSGMVKSNHMKLKKNLSRMLHTLYEFRTAF